MIRKGLEYWGTSPGLQPLPSFEDFFWHVLLTIPADQRAAGGSAYCFGNFRISPSIHLIGFLLSCRTSSISGLRTRTPNRTLKTKGLPRTSEPMLALRSTFVPLAGRIRLQAQSSSRIAPGYAQVYCSNISYPNDLFSVPCRPILLQESVCSLFD
jgi:hypothetical protein